MVDTPRVHISVVVIIFTLAPPWRLLSINCSCLCPFHPDLRHVAPLLHPLRLPMSLMLSPCRLQIDQARHGSLALWLSCPIVRCAAHQHGAGLGHRITQSSAFGHGPFASSVVPSQLVHRDNRP